MIVVHGDTRFVIGKKIFNHVPTIKDSGIMGIQLDVMGI
jgi:hypothetical protein